MSGKISIVGICGKAYSGKTTASKVFTDNGFHRYAFGDALKATCIKAGLLTYEECYVHKTKYSRDILQKVGTNLIREQVDDMYWINQWEKLIENCQNPDYWVKKYVPHMTTIKPNEPILIITDDVRFKNECHVLKTDWKATLIKTICPDSPLNANMTEEQKNHHSETEVDLIECDCSIVVPYGNVPLLQERTKELIHYITKGKKC